MTQEGRVALLDELGGLLQHRRGDGQPRACAVIHVDRCPLRQGHEVELAEALEDEERRRGVAAIGHEVRPGRRDRVRLPGLERQLLLGIAQGEPDPAL